VANTNWEIQQWPLRISFWLPYLLDDGCSEGFSASNTTSGLSAAISNLISYQGVLNNQIGEPISSIVNMTFRVYDERRVSEWQRPNFFFEVSYVEV